MTTWIVTLDDSSKTTVRAVDIMDALTVWCAQRNQHDVSGIISIERVY